MKTVYAKHKFNWFYNGRLLSKCDGGCCETTQEVKRGDIVKQNFGSGVAITLADGTVILTNKFQVLRYPEELKTYKL